MDNRLKEIVENYDKLKIGIDDTFRFHCTMCGKCCIHREDILLNPFDLFRMAKELRIEPQDVYAQYCESYIGESSHMVIVRMLPRGTVRRCPFLKDRKCSIHKVKPAVCALFPLGRTINAGNEETSGIPRKVVQYFFQNPGCGDASETHTVRDWLKDYEFLSDDSFFMKWSFALKDYSAAMKKVEAMKSDELFNMIASTVLGCIYLNYKTDEAFIPQFEENDRRLRELFSIFDA